jgi:mRNA-degrading endonuclease RelE of RelBE toxin-antitoxin system
MTYELRLARQADEFMRRLDARYRIELQRLGQLVADPFDLQYSKPLKNGQGKWSARVGDYRTVFGVDTERHEVNVTTIGP